MLYTFYIHLDVSVMLFHWCLLSYIYVSINPFIHIYMTLYDLKRNIILEYLFFWFFFTEDAVCRVTSASAISPVNIHVTFYIPVQKDAYVCRIISCRRVSRKETRIWWFMYAKEEDAGYWKSTMPFVSRITSFRFISSHTRSAKAKDSDRYRYIFFCFFFFIFSINFL